MKSELFFWLKFNFIQRIKPIFFMFICFVIFYTHTHIYTLNYMTANDSMMDLWTLLLFFRKTFKFSADFVENSIERKVKNIFHRLNLIEFKFKHKTLSKPPSNFKVYLVSTKYKKFLYNLSTFFSQKHLKSKLKLFTFTGRERKST